MNANGGLVKELVDSAVTVLVMFLTGAAYALLNDATDLIPELARIFGIAAVGSFAIGLIRVYVSRRRAS